MDPAVDHRGRFTVEEYELMGRAGVLGDDRTELLDGEIVMMSPIGPRHASVVDVLNEMFVLAVHGRAVVRIQNPVRLLPASEPQPDLVVARRRSDRYAGSHPTAEDTLLLVEAADSSLATDRAVKLAIYAREGIPEVWIVGIAGACVHVHADPVDGTYRDVHTFRRGDVLVPTTIDSMRIAVSHVLG